MVEGVASRAGTGAISIAARLELTGGRPSGFDYLRIVLALLVVLVHAVGISHGLAADADLYDSPLRGAVRLILPMFFALSGFLVAGSLLRTRSIGAFLGLRFLRIYPALTVEVLLSALLIGPLFTTLPLADYFSDPVFYRYLVNTTGHVSFALPGVFLHNPQPVTVNSQLWTVPFELYCYLSLLLLAAAGGRRWPAIYPLAALGLAAAHFGWRAMDGSLRLVPGGPMSGTLLVVCFLCGVACYLYQDRIRLHAGYFLAALGSAWVLLAWVPGGDYLAPPAITYACVYIGLTNFRRLRLLDGADYSYGIFLYGFVVQQALANLLPWSREWYLNAPLALLAVTVFAALSWHCVEKPALRLKGKLLQLESRWLRRSTLERACEPA
ncbi:MAG: acyltransferase [Rhodocyclaceae bacterium]|nr:acyltransferase [Rhodocyclaceae bacterium]